MRGSLHMALGAVVGVSGAVLLGGGLLNGLCFAGGVVAGSLAPDIDHPKSKMGRKIPISSWISNVFLGHRGVLHTPFFMAVMYFGLSSLWQRYIGLNPVLPAGFLIGYGLHLLQDIFTRGGIPLLFPITRKRYSLGFAKSGSVMDDICTILLGAFWLIVLYFNLWDMRQVYTGLIVWMSRI